MSYPKALSKQAFENEVLALLNVEPGITVEAHLHIGVRDMPTVELVQYPRPMLNGVYWHRPHPQRRRYEVHLRRITWRTRLWKKVKQWAS